MPVWAVSAGTVKTGLFGLDEVLFWECHCQSESQQEVRQGPMQKKKKESKCVHGKMFHFVFTGMEPE